jgi:hypothetical protein
MDQGPAISLKLRPSWADLSPAIHVLVSSGSEDVEAGHKAGTTNNERTIDVLIIQCAATHPASDWR